MTTQKTPGDVRDLSLANDGVARIEWAARSMPVLGKINQRFKENRNLEGIRIAACLHVTTETANLAIALKSAGAEIALCASNPLSTQDDVAAALIENYGISTFAITGVDTETYYSHITSVLETKPHITLDDGADLVAMLHSSRRDLLNNVIGGAEETTTGVIRLQSLADQGKLMYPIVAVNDADTKHYFDNRYGTGQSTIDAITRATNVLWAGKKVVICGYGWCGRGLASRASGMGAQVIVTEVNPIRALEAAMDGYQVMKMIDAVKEADIVVTVTGGMKGLSKEHFEVMKDGCMVANSGHFNVEIDIESLETMSSSKTTLRPYVEEFQLKDNRKIFLLSEGRLVNLAAGDGHPSSVMDMSFANQALSVEHVALNASEMSPNVYPVPKHIDEEVGKLKLESMNISIDELTEEQHNYLNSWEMGT